MKGEARVSVTQRPKTKELLDELSQASDLSKTELYSCGIDVLHFLWSAHEAGLKICTFDGKTYTPVEIFVPGLIRRTDQR